MRAARLFLLFVVCLLPVVVQAQDDRAEAGYAEALRRIEAARVSDATELYLTGLKLTRLPPEIGQLTALQILRLGQNELTSLPSEIGQLSQMSLLDVSYNQLTDLPSEIKQLTSLGTIDLDHNNFSTIPEGLWQLKNLWQLHLGNNELREIPAEIGQLTNLEVLSLSYNQLTTLPSEFWQLTKLQWLDLPYNQLTSLSPEIGKLDHLCHLEFHNNQIQYLPFELADITYLNEPDRCWEGAGMSYLNNPLVNAPPLEVIGTPAVLAYLREQAWYHTRHLILTVSGSIGFLAMVILGLRWRYQHVRKPKQKRKIVTDLE